MAISLKIKEWRDNDLRATAARFLEQEREANKALAAFHEAAYCFACQEPSCSNCDMVYTPCKSDGSGCSLDCECLHRCAGRKLKGEE